MRLAAKLTVALVVTIAAVLVAQSWLHVRRLEAVEERNAVEGIERAARTMAAVTASRWRSGGREEAERFISEQSELAGAPAMTLGSAPPHAPQREGEDLVAVVPVVVDGNEVATLRLSQPYDEGRSPESLGGALGTTALLLAVTTAAVMFLGGWLVARPVAALIAQARRVAEGDYGADVALPQGDELGRLSSELGTLSERLARSEMQLAEQRRARTSLQQQLRHADRLSTVGKLASGIAHELGTPLNVVTGRASMILATPELPGEVTDNARIVVDQAQRMTAIIRELLDFARRHGPKKQEASIDEVFDQACTLIEPIAEGADVTFRRDAPAGMTAQIDVGKTLQVLTNLMMNAVQAMRGGGVVTLRAREQQVDRPPDDHAEPGRYLVLSVEDEGPGISEEDLEHIFQPFFTTKRVGRGTGLGLYVCHGIIREQHGWIQVDSRVGEGSVFSVYLPKDGEGQSDG